MMMDFNGKVILITGASRGIGKAAAQMFAERGGQVVLNYQHSAALAETLRDTLPGGPHLALQADVADPAAVHRMVETVVRTYGRLDVLVNNAAIYEDSPPESADFSQWLDVWQRTINTNLVGAANVAYCAAQPMIAQGGGRIINVSSRGAYRGEPHAPAYGASKAGLNSLTQSLAKALGPHHISVSAVAPGWVETDMAAETLAGPNAADVLKQSPLGRVARPEEVAYTIGFLASDGAEFLTGSIVDVNGASYFR
jgi:NAD(P)-dependent dehydrogenase (short-subunit alcohol dehydrogenase family)